MPIFTEQQRSQLSSFAGVQEGVPWDLHEGTDPAVESALQWGSLEKGIIRRATNVGFPLYKGIDDNYYLFSTYYKQVRLKKPGMDPTQENSWERIPGTSLMSDSELLNAIKGTDFKGTFTGFDKAQALGYVDLSELDPDASDTKSKAPYIAHTVARMLWHNKGTAFVRDPNGVLTKVLKPQTLKELGVSEIGQTLVNAVAGKKGAKEAIKWFRDTVKMTVQAVKGKTGAGWKISMSPNVPDFIKHTGFQVPKSMF